MNNPKMWQALSLQIFFLPLFLAPANADYACSRCGIVVNAKLYDIEVECCLRNLLPISNGGLPIESVSLHSFFEKVGLKTGDKLLKLTYLKEQETSSQTKELLIEFERSGKVEATKHVVISSADDPEFNKDEFKKRELIRQKFRDAGGKPN